MRKYGLLFLLLHFSVAFYSCKAEANSQVTDEAVNDSVSVPQPKSVTLYFVGDAMQHQSQLDAAKRVGKDHYDYSSYFELIDSVVKAADYAVVNLEVPLGGGKGGYAGYPMFSAPDSYAVALKDAGFDLFLTANNHMLDRHDYGLRRTFHVLDSLGVDHIGTYNDAAQREKLTPFIKELNGIKFGFLNYTYGTNGIKATDGAEVNYIDNDAMAREIKKTRDAGAEMVVVCIHWGEEYQLHENKWQRNIAQFLLDQGVDLIIGGHPHVVQPMRIVDNPVTGRPSLVVYSLGNFISNMNTTDTRGGASVTCVVERDEQGHPVLKEAAYDTFFTEVPPQGSQTNYRVVPASKIHLLPASLKYKWDAFHKNSQKLFDAENRGVERIPNS